MKRFNWISILIAVILASASLAQTPKVGESAPADFGGATWVSNQPEKRDLKMVLGEVVVVYMWGIH